MANRTFNTEITYNTNCNYQQSKYTQSIDVPLSIVDMDITFTNISQPTETNFYYNDIIQINIFMYQQIGNAMPQPIKWGNVIFYYVDNDDMTQTKQEINNTPIPIDNQGNAAVQFIPHSACTIYVKYFGEPYHTTENEFVSNNLTLNARPTHIQFEEYSPYLINEDETITMNVEVTDAHTEEPIDYGLVTFMNYHEYIENRVEKIIGNPRFLIDGHANIKYSPIQLGTNDLFHNIELIRASYNYDNIQYGITWKYYRMHDDFTAIAIRRNNQLNINIPQIKENNVNKALTVSDIGSFMVTEVDPIVLQCEATLSDDTTVNDANVTFVVLGTEKEYDGETVKEKEVIKTYDAYCTEIVTRDNKKYTCFEALIDHLSYGTYEVYAQIENPKTLTDDGQEYTLPVLDNHLTTPDTPITNHETLVKDGIYLKSSKSESFYLTVKPQTNSFVLSLTNARTVVTNKIINKNDLKVIFDNVTFDDIDILTEKTCYFYIPILNAIYEGEITYENNILSAQPSNNITINNIGNYDIYAYIKGGIYTYTNNDSTIVREYTNTYSNTVEVRIRNQISLTLQLQTIKESYPSNIKYTLIGNNLSQDNINVDIYIDNVKTDITHILSNFKKTVTNTIPMQAPGQHTIKAIVNDINYLNVQQQKTFTVTKGELNINLTSSQPILTSTTTDLNFEIKHKQGSELLNLENLTFYINPTIQNTSPLWNNFNLTKVNNKLYELNSYGCLYIAGNWQVNVTCENNDYYINPNTTINFTATNVTPSCVVIDQTTNTFTNKVIYDQHTTYTTRIVNNQEITQSKIEYDSLPQKILIISKLIKDENNHLTYVNVTNTNGEYTISKPASMTNTEWQKYTIMEYHIVPQHNILNDFAEVTNIDQVQNIFDTTFSNHQCSSSDINELYLNAQSYNFKTLFVGYNEVTETINLYGEE